MCNCFRFFGRSISGFLLIVSISIIAGHNLLDSESFTEGTIGYWVWAVLHERSVLHIGDIAIRTSYPILPWIGIIAFGYWCGRWFNSDVPTSTRGKLFGLVGISMLLAFILLRVGNIYGEPNTWHIYENQLMTLMAFFNLTKYPPSLQFILMTLGPALLLLHAAERWGGKLYDVVVTFGRAPFFYYVLHLYVLHAAYRIIGMLTGYHWDGTPAIPSLPEKMDVGSIWAVWGISIVTLVILYPIITWLARIKAEKRSPLLSYF